MQNELKKKIDSLYHDSLDTIRCSFGSRPQGYLQYIAIIQLKKDIQSCLITQYNYVEELDKKFQLLQNQTLSKLETQTLQVQDFQKQNQTLLSKLDTQTLQLYDFQKQNQILLSKLETQTSQIQDLQSKLEEQLKLNETLCKKLFELKN
jgi:myosin heavy subunit